MTSLFAQLYLALQQQITANVPEIKWIDMDLGQLESYEERPAVQWPCVLIDFPAAQYSNNSDGVQWCEVNISIRLGFAPFSSTNHLTPDVSKENALQYFEIENKLYDALQGFTAGDCVQGLVRISAATERREDIYRVRELQFTTATEDDTAQNYHNKTEADLEMQVQSSEDESDDGGIISTPPDEDEEP